MGRRVMGIAKVAVMLAVCCAQNVLITQPGGARSAPVMGYGPMLIMRAIRGLGASEHASQLTVIFMCPEHASSHNSDGLKRRTRSLRKSECSDTSSLCSCTNMFIPIRSRVHTRQPLF